MTVIIKWFPPSWVQIKTDAKILYIDPAYMRTYYLKHPQKIEFTKWPDPIDGLPEKLEKADPQKFKQKIEANSDIYCAVLKIGESFCLP